MEAQQSELEGLWLVFRLGDGRYALDSDRVSGIMMLPEQITPLPEAPDYVRGIISLRGEIVPLVQLRTIFGMRTLEEEYEGFTSMLEQRKQDHLNWVEELERCVREQEKFTLATDPHKCAFGQWYDRFRSQQDSVNHHMHKIEEPHARLHQAAIEVEQCLEEADDCEDCIRGVMDRVNNEYMPVIVSLLDEAKEIFHASYREMVVTLEAGGRQIGVMVDGVSAVEQLTLCSSANVGDFAESTFIEGIANGRPEDGNILLVDTRALLGAVLGEQATA